MFQDQNRYGAPSQLGVRPVAALSVGFLSQAFGWMFAGLLLTAGVAWAIQSSSSMTALAETWFLPAIIVQFILVIAISAGIRRMSALMALALFFVYSATMGVTLSFIFLAYTGTSIAAAFVTASGMFGVAALYGAATNRSLASVGGYAVMGLIGVIIASFVNVLLLKSDTGSLLISIAGVVVFVALTAWNVQRIARGDIAAYAGSMEKAAVIGALNLYLDFINLFLFMLRIFGGRR